MNPSNEKQEAPASRFKTKEEAEAYVEKLEYSLRVAEQHSFHLIARAQNVERILADLGALPPTENKVVPLGDTPSPSAAAVERVARHLAGLYPDRLEPGDMPCIDGRMKNGEPGHFWWRNFVTQAEGIVAALASPPPTPPAVAENSMDAILLRGANAMISAIEREIPRNDADRDYADTVIQEFRSLKAKLNSAEQRINDLEQAAIPEPKGEAVEPKQDALSWVNRPSTIDLETLAVSVENQIWLIGASYSKESTEEALENLKIIAKKMREPAPVSPAPSGVDLEALEKIIGTERNRYWPAICRNCGWYGTSEEAHGGESIADTGDYSEVVCPKCNRAVDDFDLAEDGIAVLIAEVRRLQGAGTPPAGVDG